MQILEKQEQFELEVLERLNSIRVLNQLIFCGGTMLRLCYSLNRFSVDLDFWLTEEIDSNKLLLELAKRKYDLLAKQTKSPQNIKARLYNFLARRGFSPQDIQEAISQLYM